jgi:hypothetical protein
MKKQSLLPVLVLTVVGSLPLLLPRAATATTSIEPAVPRSLPLAMQWLVVATAFFVKPLYMALSLLLAWFLRRRRGSDLSALKWAMIFFFTGELFCAVNYLFFHDGSHLAEYLHMFGMALAFGFTVLAASEFLDERIVHFSAAGKSCSLLAACGKCYKTSEIACSLRLVFMIILPGLALLCAMPPLVPVRFAVQDTVILGTPYIYSHPVIYQLFETRYSPLVAAAFFLAALLTLLLRRERSWPAAKLLFAGGAGFFSFAMFRLVLLSLYGENLPWFVIWEELTELIYVATAWLFLLVFRKKPLLFSRQP